MRFGRRTAAETPGSPLACEMFVHFVASVVSESRSTAHIIRIASEARAPPTAADVVMAATTAFGAALRHCIRASAAARARSLSAARAHGAVDACRVRRVVAQRCSRDCGLGAGQSRTHCGSCNAFSWLPPAIL